ncbi:hypothetical protein [Haloprofundus salinisoli]|uniref:hypothetical protein n=1 Tax=Haloprofundus salinisoli TaxID=2876193 RepID=UPI001CCED7A4|nr:hypothetical protein [Haloprofundus salinisoli]
MATKQTETVLSQHLTNEQYAKVTEIAAEEGCSVEDLLADIVDEYVAEYESDDGDGSEIERSLHPQTRVGRHSSYF